MSLYRFFAILPAFFSLTTLGLALSLSYLAPIAVAFFIIIFDIYWLLKVSYLSFHQIASFKKMKKNLAVNWLKKLEQLSGKNWQDIYHLIILPMAKEELKVVSPTFEALKQVVYPKSKMLIVLTIEESSHAFEIARKIKQEFEQNFPHLLIVFHPQNIKGEIPGRGSNLAFGIESAKKLIDELKIPSENIIASVFDIDTKPGPQYFSCLTWHYLTVKNPLRSSYQPIPLYNNNIWQAPSFSRVVATSSTFWQMMQQERPEKLITYSAHSLPYKVLDEVGYPKNISSDDSHIFWRAYFFHHSDYQIVPLHYPVSMDAVLAKSLLKTISNQYRQQRRWAWGCEEIPYVLVNYLKNKKTSAKEKFCKTFNLIEGHWSWATSAFLIFFLGWLPIIIGGEKFNATLLSYNLPRLTGNLMALAMFGVFISAIISFRLLPPRPISFGFFKKLSLVFQWLLLPVTLIFFGALPSLDAQIRLMLGKRLKFWVTEKDRR